MIAHKTYTKINSLYKRDAKGNFVIGDFACPEFEMLFHAKWKAYEKIDGTNTSFYWDGHELRIDGKSENAQFNPAVMEMLQNKLTVEKLSEVLPPKFNEDGSEKKTTYIIYGEAYGAKIQGKVGPRYVKEGHDFRIFDIAVIGEDGKVWWLEMETVSEDPTLPVEGLVLRPVVQLFNKKGERVMVKVKTCDYRKLGING